MDQVEGSRQKDQGLMAEVPDVAEGPVRKREAVSKKGRSSQPEIPPNPATVALEEFVEFSSVRDLFSRPRTVVAGLILLAIKPVLIAGALALWPFGCFFVWSAELSRACAGLSKDLRSEKRFGEFIAILLSMFLFRIVWLIVTILALPIFIISACGLAIYTIRTRPAVLFDIGKAFAVLVAFVAVLVGVIWAATEYSAARWILGIVGAFVVWGWIVD